MPYLENLTVPVLDANIDVSGEPRLQGKIDMSLVLEIGGEKIGIVGFISTDTAFISSAGEYVRRYFLSHVPHTDVKYNYMQKTTSLIPLVLHIS